MTLVITRPDEAGRCPRCTQPVTFASGPGAPAFYSGGLEKWTDGWGGISIEGENESNALGTWTRCPHCAAKMPCAEMDKGRDPKARPGEGPYAGARPVSFLSRDEVVAELAALADRSREDPGQEIAARLALWWTWNHVRRDRTSRDEPRPLADAEVRNLERLGYLIGSFDPRGPSAVGPEGLRRLEVLRELGRFAAAKAMLRKSRAELDLVEALVDKGERWVRQAMHRIVPPEWDGYPDDIAREMKAARSGDGDSAWRLADRFEKGEGIFRDAEAASHWSSVAAAAGHPDALAKAGIAHLRAGELHFTHALHALLPVAVRGQRDARAALGLEGPLPDECRRGLASLGERGTPQVMGVLLDYVEAARSSLRADKARREMIRGIAEALRDAMVALNRRVGAQVPPAYAKACRDLADLELDPPVSFADVRSTSVAKG